MIQLKKVSIRQGKFSLNEIDLSLKSGDYATLMGVSGVGKTTLIEAICGLRRISSGRILVGGRDVSNLVPSQREIGYVPQDMAIFPTMRVDQQIGFGLSVRKQSAKLIRSRVEEVAELLEITGLLDRYPPGLSGGERQRVALARAISFRPKLLCLDEPLSSLDESIRKRLVQLLRNVHQTENVTVLHITHSRSDAVELASEKFELSPNGLAKVE